MPIILAGQPGIGKAAVARDLAHQVGATHLGIDSIARAIINAEWRDSP